MSGENGKVSEDPMCTYFRTLLQNFNENTAANYQKIYSDGRVGYWVEGFPVQKEIQFYRCGKEI
jgi:hypothetical protein